MTSFAKVKNGVVEDLIVADLSFINSLPEETDVVWVNAESKKVYPDIGMLYDFLLQQFYSPQPHDSWSFNSETCLWVPPLSYPNDGKFYIWDELAYQANNTEGWVEIKRNIENE